MKTPKGKPATTIYSRAKSMPKTAISGRDIRYEVPKATNGIEKKPKKRKTGKPIISGNKNKRNDSCMTRYAEAGQRRSRGIR